MSGEKESVGELFTCINCGRKVKEVCPGGYCRKCHVSLSFEDCCDGTWDARMMMRGGIFTKEDVKKIYLEARI